MGALRHISVYDGQRRMGAITGNDDDGFVAKDARGKKLGSFETVKQASDAISEADERRQ